MLGRWIADEGHCVERDAGSCADGKTIALSTGDNANGQSISSYFKGASTAEVMRQMGYSASAFGNRELDWQREQFLANTRAGGFPYLAANLKAKDEQGIALGLQPYVMVERKGVKVAVVGLAARKSTVTPMPGRMAGLELVSDEAALTAAIPAARLEGAEVIAIVTDGCLHDVPELLEQHQDWAPAFVAGRDCEREYPETVGATRLVYPGRHWNDYAKVGVRVDVLKPLAQRVVKTDSMRVAAMGPSKADPTAAATIAAWKKKLDDALGALHRLQQVGPRAGIGGDEHLADHLAQGALQDRRGAAQPQGRAPGPAARAPSPAPPSGTWCPSRTRSSPSRSPGSSCSPRRRTPRRASPACARRATASSTARAPTIDPKKTYTLATTDYLYLGGDGFKLHEADKAPTQTKVSWQAALIEWTKGKKSDEKKPLETLLPK